MASHEIYEQDFGPGQASQPADNDSEWILVNAQNDEEEFSTSSSKFAQHSSPNSRQTTKPTIRKTDRCGGVTDIEDSENGNKDDKKCLQCEGCKSKSATTNHSTSSHDSQSIEGNDLKGGSPKRCHCAFPTVFDDPVTHFQKLTDILRAINRSLAADLDKEADIDVEDLWYHN